MSLSIAILALAASMAPRVSAQYISNPEDIPCGAVDQPPCVSIYHGRSGCDDGLFKVSGRCKTEPAEELVCGALGEEPCPHDVYDDEDACEGDLIIVDNICEACGENGEPDCPDNSPPTPPDDGCGGDGEPPCATGCDRFFELDSDDDDAVCIPVDDPLICGMEGEPLCPNGSCQDGFEPTSDDDDATCTAVEDPPAFCGQVGFSPCSNGECASGLCLIGNTCTSVTGFCPN